MTRSLILLYKVFFIIILLGALPWVHLQERMIFNWAALNTIDGLLNNPVKLPIAWKIFASSKIHTCRAYWYQGYLANSMRHIDQSLNAWSNLISCEPDFIAFVYHIVPDNLELAEFAVHKQPKVAVSWFWLGELNAKENSKEAVRLYIQGLVLKPYDGLRWRQLGDLMREQNPEAAIQAYLQSCRNGDPGYNGCYRAGLTAEQLGFFESAILYYRLSNWEGALSRANELEVQLAEETQS